MVKCLPHDVWYGFARRRDICRDIFSSHMSVSLRRFICFRGHWAGQQRRFPVGVRRDDDVDRQRTQSPLRGKPCRRSAPLVTCRPQCDAYVESLTSSDASPSARTAPRCSRTGGISATCCGILTPADLELFVMHDSLVPPHASRPRASSPA